MAGKVNPMQGYQEATNQLLAINEQRKSNNAQAKMEETLQAAQNNTLAQASEFVASQNPQATVQPANLNPATQNILGQYGLGQPKIQKTSSSSQQVTKQNITINNKNTTITNNNVSVPANSGGPIQGRPIQFQDPGQIKFKTWLSNSFAQQNELAAKRQREYEKRDSALVRNSNKLMKKIEETGKSIATGLNPKNMASNMGSQLKTLLMVFGFARLAKEWPNLMTRVDEISKKVSEIKDNVFKFFDKNGGLSKMLGGKEGESAFTAFKNLFIDPKDGILAYIKNWLQNRFEERSAAVKNIPKPDTSWKSLGGVGNNITRILGNVIGYLGDILGAIINPGKSAASVVQKTERTESNQYSTNNIHKTADEIEMVQRSIGGQALKDEKGNPIKIKASAGAKSLMVPTVTKGYYGGLVDFALDKNGNLTNRPESSISQGNELNRIFNVNAKEGNIQTASAATGLSRLYNSAKNNKSVIVNKQFIDSFLDKETVEKLGLKKEDGYYISRPKTDLELAIDYARYTGNAELIEDLMKLGGGLAGMGLGAIAGPWGAAGGATIGYGIGEELGKIINEARRSKIPKETIEIQTGEEINLLGGRKMIGPVGEGLYKLDENQVKQLIQEITGSDEEISLDNHRFVSAVEEALIKRNKSSKITKDININQVYSPNIMAEQHKQEEHQMLEESRMSRGVENTKSAAGNLFNNAKDRVSGIISPEKVKKVNPSNIDSGDLSGVIEASKRGVLYSDSSGGYIPLGKDLSGFMHKCTSGPATFYDDGTGGKIKLNGKWWNTGSPKTATGTNIDKEGFKLVWNGTAEQGWDTSRIKATGFELQPGDIMLNFGRGKNGNSSHAQMWNGEEWISDTHQGQRSFVYRGGGRLGDKSAQIWRYDAGIEKQDIDLASTEIEADGLLDQEDVNSGFTAFENEQQASNILPEIDVTPSSINTPIPEYTATVDYSSANISNDYPGVFSNGGAKGNNNFTSTSKENPNYTADLNSIVADLKTMLGVLNIMGQTDAQTLEATNNVVSAVGSLRSNNNQPSIPYAPSFTDGQYNQNPIS